MQDGELSEQENRQREDTDMAAREEGTAKMTAFARRQPLRQLAEALEILDRKPRLDNAERLARAVLMDVICERSPAADAALERWADGDDPRGAVEVIAAAVAS